MQKTYGAAQRSFVCYVVLSKATVAVRLESRSFNTLYTQTHKYLQTRPSKSKLAYRNVDSGRQWILVGTRLYEIPMPSLFWKRNISATRFLSDAAGAARIANLQSQKLEVGHRSM